MIGLLCKEMCGKVCREMGIRSKIRRTDGLLLEEMIKSLRSGSLSFMEFNLCGKPRRILKCPNFLINDNLQ